MKQLYYIGLTGLILFEIANVYFIMPMPGSQQMNSLDLAYFLYHWRWVFRGAFALTAILGAKAAFSGKKWLPILLLIVFDLVAYMTNFVMAADKMFYQPNALSFKPVAGSGADSTRLVLGITHGGVAKAYPIQYLGYHHQVRDTLGGKPVMVTYCTVCRTGRVYEPVVDGRPETFRLVGMDHFNAMFEDETSGSWWRQVSGEAVAGPLKGHALPEFPSMQTTLGAWTALHPNTLLMQPDTEFRAEYDSLADYETGKRKGRLTRRDTASWQDKSWVIGVDLGKTSKAYDWNQMQQQRIVHDTPGGQPIVLTLAGDGQSFAAFRRTDATQQFSLQGDTLVFEGLRFNMEGRSLQVGIPDLERIRAYQEYWHSWRTFHPGTER